MSTIPQLKIKIKQKMPNLSQDDDVQIKDEPYKADINQQPTSSEAVDKPLNVKKTLKMSCRKTILRNDLSSMPLCELIHHNPSLTIYQAEEQKDAKIKRGKTTKSKSPTSNQSSLEGKKADLKNDLSCTFNGQPVLMLDKDGNIIMSNPSQYEEKADVKIPISNTTKTFRQSQRSANIWNKKDTNFFYEALEKVGTDFSLMEELYFKNRGRDRKHLKQKFKREEKVNREIIDAIIYKFLDSRINLQ